MLPNLPRYTDGYVTDVDYVAFHPREVEPAYQRFNLLLRGFATPSNDAPRVHCELGFGQGISLNIHAAASTDTYIGVDFNPVHVANATALATHSGANVHLLESSFAALLMRDELPQFDSISTHGVWSWITPENRRAITAFCAKHLKPGGTFYASYSCHPGAATTQPMRQLLSLYARTPEASGDSVMRATAAFAFVDKVLEAAPKALEAVPLLANHFKQARTGNPKYLAHDYMNQQWQCFTLLEVADDLRQAGLEYACTGEIADLVDVINLDDKALAVLATVEPPIVREQLRDYFVNRSLRKDISVREPTRLSEGERMARLYDMRFTLIRPADELSLTRPTLRGDAHLQEHIYRPLVEALATEGYAPKTLRHLETLKLKHSPAPLVEALVMLIEQQLVYPCADADPIAAVRRQCLGLNRALCERALTSDDVTVLASPITGGGIPVNRFSKLFLRAAYAGHRSATALAEHVWQAFRGRGERLVKDGVPLTDDHQNIELLTAMAQRFEARELPLFRALGII